MLTGPRDGQVLPSTVMPVAASAGWYDRYRQWYTRTLSSDRFRRLAARLPFTRPVARRHADRLFDLCAGFVYTQTLLACLRLDLFALLADGSKTLGAIAEATGLPVDRAGTLVRAAVALDLLEERGGGRYGLGMFGAVVHGDPGIAAMIRHHELVYRDLGDPVSLLRGGASGEETGLSDFWPYADGAPSTARDEEAFARYSELMSASLPGVADQVIDGYPLSRCRRVMDVGGGDGSFARLVSAACPHLQMTVVDLPQVVATGEARNAAAGLGDRVSMVGANFLTDALPTGHDLVTLVRVTFDHPDETVATLLGAIRASLEPGARLLLVEPLAGERATRRVTDGYFGPYLMAMGRGRPRTQAHYTELLQAAGFGSVRRHATNMPLHADLLEATAR